MVWRTEFYSYYRKIIFVESFYRLNSHLLSWHTSITGSLFSSLICLMIQYVTTVIISSSMYQNPLLLDTQPDSSKAMKQMKEVIISETPLLMKLDAVPVFWGMGLCRKFPMKHWAGVSSQTFPFPPFFFFFPKIWVRQEEVSITV